MKWQMKKNSTWIILGTFLLFDFVFRAFVALSNDIAGDGAMHAMIAREIARTLRLQPYYPCLVTGGGIFYPVCYPQFFFLLLAGCYTLGQEIGIKLLAPLLGTLTVFVVFVYVQRFFGNLTAFIASFLLIGEGHLFLVTTEPFMESAVILFSVIPIFEYFSYTLSKAKQNLLLASIFLGLLLATKLQSILIAVILCVFALVLTIKQIYDEKVRAIEILKKNSKSLFLLLLISIAIASPLLYFQLSTTGTVDYPPASDITHVFFKPKWIEDEESIKWIVSRARYQTTLLDVVSFSLQLRDYPSIFSVLLSTLVVLGFVCLILNEEHDFLLLAFSFYFVYFVIMLYMNANFRYFFTLPILSTVIAAVGASWVLQKTQKLNLLKIDLTKILHCLKIENEKNIKLLTVAFVIVFLVIPTLANIQNNYMNCYKASDRAAAVYWQDRIGKVKAASEWLRVHATSTDITLVDRWNEVGYYSERYVMCISELGGHNIPKIYAASTIDESLKYLEEYNITYIWISQLQIGRGTYEWIPRHGLLDFIEFAPSCFEKVYQNDLIRIYRVSSSPNDFILKDKHYYANVFGDFDDVYDVSPIIVRPADVWVTNSSCSASRTLLNKTGFIRVYINQTDLTLDTEAKLYSNTSLTFVLYYWDIFTESVNVDLRITNGTHLYHKNISRIDGTGDGNLRWKIIQIKNLCYQVYDDKRGAYYIEFRITTETIFPLRIALLIPGSINLTNDQCENWAGWLTKGGA